MSDDIPKYYWDACAWIGFINTEKDKHTSLRAYWEDAEAGKCEIWTSAFVYIEVHKAKAQGGDPYPPAESDRRIDQALDQPFVKRVQLDSDIAKLARDLRRKHPGQLKKKADAIHLATAVWWDLDELHTYDASDLLPLNGKITRNDGNPLPIIIPDYGTLFAGSHASRTDEETD